MKPAINDVCQEFSKGNFPFCYPHFADAIEWKIIGSKTLTGRENVIAYCEQMRTEMTASTFTNFNTVTGNRCIIIEGNCTFTGADDKPGEVSYCDVYHFDDDKITGITSYCI